MTLLLQLNLGMAWGQVNPPVAGPYVEDLGAYIPGPQGKAAQGMGIYHPGAFDSATYSPGAQERRAQSMEAL